MSRPFAAGYCALNLLVFSALCAEIKAPAVRDARLEIRLFASEPDIVTPIGIAVDARGRIFVVESHTHFPPKDYAGPKHDRVRLFEDTDHDGKPDKITNFADGLHHAMNLAFAPDGKLFLAHRNGVLRLDDQDSDGANEARATILQLDTPGDYPHNGLGGLAFSRDGWLYVGLGENLGARYTLKGSDGSSHTGGGEGGNVFRCRPDGSKLELVATGFWNPFGLACYGDDYLLTVDNDPDSRPPNRLIDVVKHGDYGYKFRYGRSGLHPYTAWNGELPGTLPMMAGTGEAASGILACDHARLPKDYRGALLVTSWGDHRLELYRPKHVGASLRAERETLVDGDEWFRPVALAAAPDGAVYFTDWVDRDYSVHRKGRIWKLSAKADAEAIGPFTNVTFAANRDRRELQKLLGGEEVDADQLFDALVSSDPFFRGVAIGELSHSDLRDAVKVELASPNPRTRLGALLALRHGQMPDPASILEKALEDTDEQVRLMALVWAGEARLSVMSNQIGAALKAGPVSPALLRAHAMTAAILSPGKVADPGTGQGVAAMPSRVFQLETRVDEEQMASRLNGTGDSGDLLWRLEAVRSLAGAATTRAVDVLKKTALAPDNPDQLRAEAIVALANRAFDVWPALLPLLDDRSAVVQIETTRFLRGVAMEPKVREALEKRLKTMESGLGGAAFAEQLRFAIKNMADKEAKAGSIPMPATLEEWRKALQQPGDAASGRRVFFHPGVGCGRCHRIEDHGGYIGPDLSTIARSADREKLILSVLEPSREIAPQFATHEVATKEGETHSGLLVGQDADGSVTLMLADGKAVLISGAKVVSNTPSKTSLMPDELEQALTVQDFRDLLAFLLSRK
jgi:putative membrane-bound dehydrogenase-like protein